MRRRARTSGFTLVELIASLVIVGTLAGVGAGVIMRSGEAFGDATERHDLVVSATAAMDRVLHLARQSPGMSDLSTSGFRCASGVAVAFSGNTVTLADAVGTEPLCTDVAAFELVYLDADGVAVNPADGDAGSRAARVVVRIAVRRGSEVFESRGIAAVRSRFGWRSIDG